MHGLSLSICLDAEIETAQPRPSWSIVSRSLRRPWTQSLHFLVSPLFFPPWNIIFRCLFLVTRAAVSFHCHHALHLFISRFTCEHMWKERTYLLKKLIGHYNQYINILFCRRNKNGDSYGIQDGHTGSGGGGGGIGKWLREHLGGGSKGSHDVNSTFVSKENASTNGGNNKSLGKTIYTSQNLYCSLPREHGRAYTHNSGRKINHGNFAKSHGYDRPRSNSMNHHEKSISSDLGTLTRGGPIYGSEGRSLKKRNRDSRRYSLHETHDQGRHRQRR